MSSTNPAVATTSPSHRWPAERSWAENVTGARSNIRLASTEPAIAPAVCATMYPARSVPDRPVPARRPRNQSAADTTGLKCAPETGPKVKIRAPSASAVAIEFGSS